MRDKEFIARHRGGLLEIKEHRLLIGWACECVEHILPLLGEQADQRIIDALEVAKDWGNGSIKTGVAMKASVRAHQAARDFSDPVPVAVARAAGHAVATAHMADHSLGASLYTLKAVRWAGKSVAVERIWQDSRLPRELSDMVIRAREKKEKHFK